MNEKKKSDKTPPPAKVLNHRPTTPGALAFERYVIEEIARHATAMADRLAAEDDRPAVLPVDDAEWRQRYNDHARRTGYIPRSASVNIACVSDPAKAATGRKRR